MEERWAASTHFAQTTCRFDAGDSVGAAHSTALQPRPGPPDILREPPGLRAALGGGGGMASRSGCALPPHLAPVSSVQRGATGGESWCRSRARGLAMNCLPTPPQPRSLPSTRPTAPTAGGLPTTQDAGCRGDGGTLPANWAHQRPCPRRAAPGAGKPATSCSSVCSSVQFFTRGSHTVNHERAGPDCPPGPERIYLRILSCTHVRTCRPEPVSTRVLVSVHMCSCCRENWPRSFCVSVLVSRSSEEQHAPVTRVSFACCRWLALVVCSVCKRVL